MSAGLPEASPSAVRRALGVVGVRFTGAALAAGAVVIADALHLLSVGGAGAAGAAILVLAGQVGLPLLVVGGFVGLGLELLRRGATDAESATSDPPRRAARAVFGALVMAALVLAVQAAVVHFSATMRKPIYQGLAAGLVGAATLLVSLGVQRPSVAVLRLVFVGLERVMPPRSRSWSPASPRGAWLIALVGVCVGAWALPRVRPEFATIDLRPAYMLALWGFVSVGLALRRPGSVERAVAAAFAVVAGAGCIYGAAALPGDSAARLALSRDTIVGARALGLWARLGDADADGVAGRWVGGDCDDANARISPSAFDVPRNGTDENCSGADLVPSEDPYLRPPRPPGAPSGAPPAPRRVNVVLLTIDALRADAARRWMPNLMAFAEGGARFDAAYAHGAATYWSVPALVASTLPSRLEMAPDQTPAEKEVLLAEVLRDKGWHTALFANVTVFFVRGLKQGCVVTNYETSDFTKHGDTPGAEHLTNGVLKFVDQWRAKPTKDRFFVWAHYYDPHDPYGEIPSHPAEVDSDEGRYAASVRYVDDHLGRLFEGLRSRGLEGETVVIVTADHGDEFGDHGHRFHGSTLYEEMVNVPLVIRGPGVAPAVVDVPVGHIDVAPTLLDLVGVPAPDRWMGRSLAGALRSGTAPAPSPVAFEILPDTNYGVHRVGARVGHVKALFSLDTGLGELYDLASDPGERDNLWDEAAASSALEPGRSFLLRYIDHHAFALGQGKTGATLAPEGKARR